ncbi:hypothetical protein FJ366_01350 [Candidatus Dependentiae bacterium]|nr:hypothetical protein [Candidatus Dependentiae bacterium]
MSYLEHDADNLMTVDGAADSTPEVTQASNQAEEKEVKVEIACAPVSESQQVALKLAISGLSVLKDEIKGRIKEIWERAKNIETVMNSITEAAGSTIDLKKKDALLESVAMYASLLEGIIAEIESEVAEFSPYGQSGHPETILVPESDARLSSDKYLDQSIKFLRSQAKSIRKYLMVSYSRYMYGFERQEMRLGLVINRINQIVQQQQKLEAAKASNG